MYTDGSTFDMKELEKLYPQKKTVPMQPEYYPYYHPQGICPNCGYCPHCGRGRHDYYRFPYITC